MGFSVDKIAEAVDQTVTDVNKWLNRESVIIKHRESNSLLLRAAAHMTLLALPLYSITT